MERGNGRLNGREVVIVEAVRTPVGRGHPEKGYYKDLHPSNLLARTYSELITRSGIDPIEVGDVIATGTPAGVGAGAQPPEFLQPGDEMECEIGALGVLRTSIGPVVEPISLDIH